jgi:hypothetical protein
MSTLAQSVDRWSRIAGLEGPLDLESGSSKNGAKNAEARAAPPADAKSCTQAKPGITNLPIERIADAVDRQADRAAGRHRQGGVGAASGLLGGNSADAAGPAGGDGDVAESRSKNLLSRVNRL